MIARKFGLDARYERSGRPYLHSGRSAEIVCNQTVIGYVGEVHPNVAAQLDVKQRLYIAEIDLDLVDRLADPHYRFRPIAKFPPVERDLAVIVDEDIAAAQLLDIVRAAGGSALQNCGIFDIYRSEAIGQGKKSVAISMEFRLADRTLTDEEVAAKTQRILNKLIGEVGASLRE